MKKILIVSVLVIYCCLNVFGQCSNPDCGEDLDVCGQTADLTVISATTGFWSAYLDGTPATVSFIPDNTSTSVEITIGEFTEPLLQLEFVWIDQSGPCTDTVLVNFYQKPEAFAGEDDAVCGNHYVFGAEFSIPESENYIPSGVWSYGSGPVGDMCDISAPDSNNSGVLVSGVGIWSFCRIETNSMLPSCYSIDTVQVEFVEIPVVYAGNDKDVCGPCAQLEGVSAGFVGSWMPNGAAYDDYSDQNTEACVSVYGSKSFIWLESNSALTSSLGCSDLDTVVITFWRIPTANILTDEADSTVCGLTFDHLRAENPGTGIYGHWWNENPAVIFTPLNLETSVTVPSYGYHDFYWIEESRPEYMPNGWCADTAGPLTIHFLNEHPIHAGFDHDVFGFEGELTGSSITETDHYADCNYLWICNDADIESNTSLQTSVIVGGYGIYEFILVSQYVNMYSCTDADTVKINFRDPIYIGVIEMGKGDFDVFPNPADNYITILSDKIINSVQIFDINGKLLKSVSDNYEDIDISDFGQGMYFILINTDDEVLKRKFVR
ncbi:MAG TPA: T9SS type A sorting domain-containing protein [Bacteroidales bacterium]|nr:T9SS type A sorting domain-containing protein [Bacteroidales bacterium]